MSPEREPPATLSTENPGAVWLAWSLCALALVLLGLTVLLASLGWSAPLPQGWGSWQGRVVTAVGVSGAPILGGLIASRRPENPYGWLWIGLGLGLALAGFAQCYAAYALVAQPGSLPFPRAVGSLVAGVGWFMWLIFTPLVLLLFPTGRPPSRRWRFLVRTIVSVGSATLLLGPFIPGKSGFVPVENPFGVGGVVGRAITVLDYAGVLIILASCVPAALSLVFRYRRASGVERQQLKWFALGAIFIVAELSLQFAYEAPGAWDAVVEVVPLAVLYAAVGVAILRYRLYDIDRIINKTLVYGSLTAALASVYLGVVVSLQYAFRTLTGSESQFAVVASTLAIAALFVPLRRRVQNAVDRRFYRNKYDAKKTLAAFGARLRDETDLECLSEDLVTVARETVQPEHASLWLKPTGDHPGAGGKPG